jgi:hypothetical protein
MKKEIAIKNTDIVRMHVYETGWNIKREGEKCMCIHIFKSSDQRPMQARLCYHFTSVIFLQTRQFRFQPAY